jgi:hypothetical protein
MFDSFKRLLGLKKAPAPKKARDPIAKTFSILDTREPSSRTGHTGQFTKAVDRRRRRKKIAKKSKQINRRLSN